MSCFPTTTVKQVKPTQLFVFEKARNITTYYSRKQETVVLLKKFLMDFLRQARQDLRRATVCNFMLLHYFKHGREQQYMSISTWESWSFQRAN